MEEIINVYKKKKKSYYIAQVLNGIAIIAMIFCTIVNITAQTTVFIILGVLFLFAAIVFLCSSSSEFRKAERQVMREVWKNCYSSEEAREKMLSLGLRKAFVNVFIQQEESISKLNEKRRVNQAAYEQACYKCEEVLKTAKKPQYCNKARIVSETTFFKGLKDYQYCTEWDIWRNDNKLYFYIPQMEGYPTFYDEAPYAFSVMIDDIQYFKEDGSVKNELKISGGTIKQDKRTGKIFQTPIKSKTIERDDRRTVLTLNMNSVISKMEFSHDTYDVLFALIPEKEYNRVKNNPI